MKKKKPHVYNHSTGRDYKYDSKYQSSPTQKKNRAARNKARNELRNYYIAQYGKVKAEQLLKNRDVDHIKPLSKGGSKTAKSNRRLLSVAENRGSDRPHGKRKKRRK